MKGNTDNSGPQSRNFSEAEREALFKRLHLAHMRRIYQDVAVQAEKEGWSYADFLTLLLAEEVAGRKQTRLQRLTRSAHFPFLKTMDEFDFSLQSTLRLALLGSYLGPELVSEGRSLILHGKTGRGKTHLAVAIGYRAIQNGFETLFTTAAELIEDLSNASKKGRLQESLATYTHPHVLVIDEVGHLTYAQDAANVLFHVVNGCPQSLRETNHRLRGIARRSFGRHRGAVVRSHRPGWRVEHFARISRKNRRMARCAVSGSRHSLDA